MYRVFVRDWWRWRDTPNGGRFMVSYPGAPKTTLAHVSTEAEARSLCEAYALKHEPGPLSRKAEYTLE